MPKLDLGPFIPERYDIMKYWVVEREKLRRARIRNEAPRTKDPILLQTRFCNVRRMDDRVSIWLMERWFRPGLMNGRDAVMAAMIGRTYNKVETLTALGIPYKNFNVERMRKVLYERSKGGEAVFGGAYIINGNGRPGQDKISFTTEAFEEAYRRIGRDAQAAKLLNPDSLQWTAERLDEIKGVGTFMAGQMVADLRHIYQRHRWLDKMTWAPPGPGSSRGMRFILGESMECVHGRGHDLKPKQFLGYLGQLIQVMQRDQELLPIIKDRRLEAHDVQNILCETSKYARIQDGGRAKNQYKKTEEPFADEDPSGVL